MFHKLCIARTVNYILRFITMYIPISDALAKYYFSYTNEHYVRSSPRFPGGSSRMQNM